jgi:hypothetical protein
LLVNFCVHDWEIGPISAAIFRPRGGCFASVGAKDTAFFAKNSIKSKNNFHAVIGSLSVYNVGVLASSRKKNCKKIALPS